MLTESKASGYQVAWAVSLCVGLMLLGISAAMEFAGNGAMENAQQPVSHTETGSERNVTDYTGQTGVPYQALAWGIGGFSFVFLAIIIRWIQEASRLR